MASLTTYKKQLSKLEEKRSSLMRAGKYMQCFALNDDIKEIENLIKQAEAYEEATKSKPIKEILSREEIDEMGIIPLMIECHLVSDFLVEITYMISDICKSKGLSELKFSEDITKAIKANEVFASFLTKMSTELSDLLIRNETFNASLHKKYQKYIEQRLSKPKSKNA